MMAATKGANLELEQERKTSTFDPVELTNILDEGVEGTEQRHYIEQFYIRDPSISNHKEFNSLSCDDVYTSAIASVTNLVRKLKGVDLPGQILGNLAFIRSTHITTISTPCEQPTIVHQFMFTPTLESHGTEEQQAKWLPLAKNDRIIGTYAQTELGHGTNIRSLETTATYDPKTQEFVLHSPTLTSIKFWPGGLGRTCNYGIVIAQLYSKGQCHGIHPFMVQLRSLKDHTPMPGIIIGELGAKMGMNASDNGFLQFKQVRIPRDQMLMKHNKILPDGTYVKPGIPRVNYGTLVLARVAIVLDSSLRMAQAVTIAVRYSCVRRQGESRPGMPETKIIDYQTHQYKLFPYVAAAFGGLFAFRALRELYMEVIADPTAEKSVEIHALSSGLKSICTEMGAAGAEQSRLACGGLGYLQASRLPNIYSYITASCTYDGENTVMLLQTARFLVKSYRAVKAGTAVSATVKYLAEVGSDQSRPRNACEELVLLYQKTAARLLTQTVERLDREISSGKSAEDAWNNNSVELVKCAKIHSKMFVISVVSKVLCDVEMSSSLNKVLNRLFELLGLFWVREHSGDFLQYGGVSYEKLDLMNSRVFTLLAELRPDIVALVDAFDFRDESLHSVIGCYDGRVYERVYDYVKNLPSNQRKVHPVFEKYLNPMMKSKL